MDSQQKSRKAPTKKGVFSRIGALFKPEKRPIHDIPLSDFYAFGGGFSTVASLLGAGRRAARSRQEIYEKWAQMEADPIISTAVNLLVTAALGGHETSGQLVFVEPSVRAKNTPQLEKIAAEIEQTLSPLFNKVAFQMLYTSAIFGDAYARIYSDQQGVKGLYIDEMVRPPMVQAFERGGETVGFLLTFGTREIERLDSLQMARLKMPRQQWVPQHGVIEKSMRIAMGEDNPENMPILPAAVGGSLLFNAEEAYVNFCSALLGLVGQRWLDSIDEQILTVNSDGMTHDQSTRFVQSLVEMLKKSKKIAENAVFFGKPVMERVRHIVPIHGDKQMINITPSQSARSANIQIEDVMFHAKLLSGALGVDLSMLGFADQLSGGLGEGGFFRVSAQVAERARVLRVALSQFFDDVINVHTLKRYGVVFQGEDRPWRINFFGSISALEAEKQQTRTESMNSGMILLQSIQQLKELGADEKQAFEFLSKTMMLDADQAELFAKMVSQGENNQEQD